MNERLAAHHRLRGMPSSRFVLKFRRSRRWNDVAVLNVGSHSYAKDLNLPRELGVAYLDGQTTPSWPIEQEERWRSSKFRAALTDHADSSAGLNGFLGAKELRSATVGYQLYARRELVLKDDVQRAEQWTCRAVPETPTTAVLVARDVAFLREVRRLATSP